MGQFMLKQNPQIVHQSEFMDYDAKNNDYHNYAQYSNSLYKNL